MGNDIEELNHLQGQWDSGAAIGPRVWKAGLIDGRGPFQAPTAVYADTVEEAQAAVNRYADLGYVQIKVYSSLRPELVPQIVKTAHARGLRVSGHIPNGMIASQFVDEGADEVQHINFIDVAAGAHSECQYADADPAWRSRCPRPHLARP